MKRGELLVLLSMFALLTIPLMSAGFFDNFYGRLTGKATSNTNVTISVAGTNPAVVRVVNKTMSGTDVDPTTGSYTAIKFFVNVTDIDGVADLNDSSINASFAFKEQSFYSTKRTNSSTSSSYNCKLVSDYNTTMANYSCTVKMWFFDPPGQWNITVYGRDLGLGTNQLDNSRTFQYDTLQAISIQPKSLTFPSVSPGGRNQTSTNDPTLINNTGNANFTILEINSTDLKGFETPSEFIPAFNFSVGNQSTGATAEECGNAKTETFYNDTILTAQVFKRLSGNFSLNRGNNSLNDNFTGQETYFWCLRHVPPGISSQVYNTTAGNAWTLRFT